MRDPARIDQMLDLLRRVWSCSPDLRLGQLIVKLHELGLINREPGVARSIRVAIPEEEIPPLEDAEGWPR